MNSAYYRFIRHKLVSLSMQIQDLFDGRNTQCNTPVKIGIKRANVIVGDGVRGTPDHSATETVGKAIRGS